MTRRPFAAAALGALVAFATSAPAHAVSVDCTSTPADAVGYHVKAVHADAVNIPAAAPAIAVLDSGVADVPELSGRLRAGYNVATGGQNTNDIDGHGTAVAAIAAATPGGVRGISPTSPIVPIKMFDDAGNASPDAFVSGIERAIAANAGVINVSAEASPADVDAATARQIQNAIDSAVSLGIPVIAASGNEGAGAVSIPAAYPHVISVGATNESGAVATFSNTGSALDLVAPGANIVTAAPGFLCSSGYATVTGTSFAAPIVAGAAALLLAEHTDLDGLQLADMLRLAGVRSPAPAWDSSAGFGLLDVAAALSAPVPSPDQPEVNDTIYWAKQMPVSLAAPKRSATLYARIAPHLDPSDVYRLRLEKGDWLRVRLQQPSGTQLKLAFGATRLSAKRGTSFTRKITKTGQYFVGVTIAKSPPAGSGYALLLRR